MSSWILSNFLSDYFIDLFGYKDLKIISHKSTKISKHEYFVAKKCTTEYSCKIVQYSILM